MVLSRRVFKLCRLAAFILPFVLVFTFGCFHFQVALVTGTSMEPSFHNTQVALASRTRTPQRGDVVLFHPPFPRSDETFIKRVIALPGDVLTIHEGSVYVNGEALAEPYLRGAPTPGEFGPVLLAEGDLFVMGDNRAASLDSRYFGPIPLDQVVGVVFFSAF